MTQQVFFYGTLRTGFNRTTRAGIDTFLKFSGRAWINGKLFDLGIYPAAVPATDARVWGEKSSRWRTRRRCWRRSIASKDIARRSRSEVSIRVRAFPQRWTMAGRKMCGCISTMRRSGARRGSRQATIWSTCDRESKIFYLVGWLAGSLPGR